MLEAMIKEITDRSGYIHGSVETIYFGGGTPSLLSEKDLKRLLDTVYKNFNVIDSVEITIEANPDDIDPASLQSWGVLGINRISIGVQSFVPMDLEWMNRFHNAARAFSCISQVKEAGFLNYSVDLIFGTPTLPDSSWKENIQTLLSFEPPHIAAYALTVEPFTALDKMIRLNAKDSVDMEKQARQFVFLMQSLDKKGYLQYEISNFCLPGKKSRHNSSYWQGVPYLGIGPSAHSYNGNTRSWNISNNSQYIRGIQTDQPIFEIETLTDVQRLNEYIMTGLRTTEGISLAYVETHFGQAYANEIEKAAEQFCTLQQVVRTENDLTLTTEGKLFADGIASSLFF